MGTVGNTSVPPNNKISLTGPSQVEIFMYRMMIKHALSERGKQSVSHFPRNALITAVRLAARKLFLSKFSLELKVYQHARGVRNVFSNICFRSTSA